MKRASQALSRRGVMLAAVAAATRKSAWSHEHSDELTKPYGWVEESICGRKVYVRGQGSRIVILLHELNGLSPGSVDFGVELASHGFKVYMQLLFGHVLQNSALLGGVESCWFAGFHCFAAGGEKETKPVLWVSGLVSNLCARDEVKSIGVSGMCETGAYPVATMRKGTKVKAIVLSQPALPFGQNKHRDVGLTQATMQRAKESEIPILGPPHFEQTWTHRLDAVLTGSFGEIRENARRTAIEFLADRLQ